MAKAEVKPQLTVITHFTVDEIEARALIDLAGYGTDAFIKAFYDNLGKAYMQKHEEGLRRFLDTITSVVCPAMREIDKARSLLKNS